MVIKNIQGALITRDAFEALLNLKSLVEQATDETHAAAIEAIGLTVQDKPVDESLRVLRKAADQLSSRLDNAVEYARKSVDAALAWHLEEARRKPQAA